MTTDQYTNNYYLKINKYVFFLLCSAITAVSLTLLSHDPIADGPRRLFAIALVQLLVGSLVLGIVVNRYVFVDTVKATGLAVLLVLAGCTIHVARIAHPLSRSILDANLTWRLGEPLPPEIEARSRPPGPNLRAQGPYELTTIGGAGNALQVVSPSLPNQWPWWAPVGASLLARSHHLVVEATSERSAPYFIVIKSGKLRIQLTSAGIMITAPDGKGDVSERTMTAPVVTDGTAHRWELTAEPERAGVLIDGKEIWSIPRSAEVGTAFDIGDASGDREHGGSLRVENLRYQRVPTRLREQE